MTIPATGHVTYILSAERANLSAEINGFRTLDLKRDLGRMFATGDLVAVVEVEGSYKGQREASFAVTLPSGADGLRAIMGVAFEYQQESVLAIIETGHAFLHYCEPVPVEPIGQYKPLALDELEAYEAWTVVKATGQAFTFE